MYLKQRYFTCGLNSLIQPCNNPYNNKYCRQRLVFCFKYSNEKFKKYIIKCASNMPTNSLILLNNIKLLYM